jgi:hypothetical protein
VSHRGQIDYLSEARGRAVGGSEQQLRSKAGSVGERLCTRVGKCSRRGGRGQLQGGREAVAGPAVGEAHAVAALPGQALIAAACPQVSGSVHKVLNS